MSSPPDVASLRQALARAEQRLTDVLALTGALLGTLDIELQTGAAGDAAPSRVRADGEARRLLGVHGEAPADAVLQALAGATGAAAWWPLLHDAAWRGSATALPPLQPTGGTPVLNGTVRPSAPGRVIVDLLAAAASTAAIDLCAHRQAEAMLQERESVLRATEGLAHVGSWRWNIETGEQSWSAETCRLFGVDAAAFAVTAQSIFALVHPEDRDRLARAQADAVSGAAPFDLEYRVITPAGELRHLHGRAQVLRDPASGRPLRMLGIALDISARKRSEAALRESRQRFHDFAESSADWYWETDAEGRFVTVGDGVMGPPGVPPREFLGRARRALDGLLEGPDAELWQRHRADLAAQRPFRNLRYGRRRPNGEVRHFDVSGRPFHDEGGRLLGWRGIGRDVTALTRAQDELRRTSERLARIFRSSPAAIAVVRLGGPFIELNDAFERLYGYTRDEIAGRTADEIGLWVDLQERDRFRARCAADGGIRGFVTRTRHRNGELREVEISAELVQEHGETLLLVISSDVTERQRAERSLRELADELERRVAERTQALVAARDEAQQASRAKSNFLSGMSHELRTPLNAILGFGQLLQMAPQALPARERSHVDQIVLAGTHLLQLISEMLDLARIEAGKLAIMLEPVALAPVVADCVSLMRPAAAEQGVELLTAPLDEGAPARTVLADRTRLKQVLLNLLSNAIKYNRAGGQARVACRWHDGAAVIEVADTGPGLSDAHQRRLFRDFERLDADRAAIPGAGIGLALSRRLVEMMAGEIGVRSEVGSGSVLWVWLQRPPQTDPPVPAGPPAALAGPSGPTALRRQRWTVLLIEDNAANALLVEAALQQHGDLRLLHAALPGRGLDIARAERPDLVLLDIQMTGMDSYEVLRRLRADAATREVPVIAVGADTMPEDLARAAAAGFLRCVTKPIDLQQLRAAVESALPR